MRPWLLSIPLLALSACLTGRQASEPPVRYRVDTTAAVRFGDTASLCAGVAHEPGVSIDACNLNTRIIMPNPCAWPGNDSYAQLLCHELGHWNGWPAGHPTS